MNQVPLPTETKLGENILICVFFNVVGAVLLVGMQGIAVNVDPILSTWLLYHSQRPTTSRQTQQVGLLILCTNLISFRKI